MEHIDTNDLLRRRGLRVTERKREVFDTLHDSGRPLTAQELHSATSERVSLDLATVYRNLTQLREAGLVREIGDPDGQNRFYEVACIHNPPHPHFRCDVCGRVDCLRSLDTDDTRHIAGFAEGHEVREITVTIGGVCRWCGRKNG